ncbi:DMT family transporter [Corynebacterium sp. L4756]|uniref:DMT family transporter n=1 Tax=unclassified Corynebacterium TaxID=2624378 RepID=UPI00374D3693
MSDAPDGMAGTIGGVGLGLVAGVTYALYSWSAYQMMSRGIGRAAAMGSIFGLGGLALVPVLLITGAPLLASAQNFAVGAYMALVPMFIGYVLFGYGLSKVSPSTATTITLAEPALAAVLAVVIVGERLPMFGWLGLFAIALSLVVLTTATKTTSSRSEVVPLGLPHETH